MEFSRFSGSCSPQGAHGGFYGFTLDERFSIFEADTGGAPKLGSSVSVQVLDDHVEAITGGDEESPSRIPSGNGVDSGDKADMPLKLKGEDTKEARQNQFGEARKVFEILGLIVFTRSRSPLKHGWVLAIEGRRS
ncbi:hypothetical protein U1Q18_040541 [Sarracenia purpurea var. burkii]